MDIFISHPERLTEKVSKIETLTMLETLISLARGRDDQLGRDLLSRLTGVTDLVSEEAKYHRKCYSKLYFYKAQNKPVSLYAHTSYNTHRSCTNSITLQFTSM